MKWKILSPDPRTEAFAREILLLPPVAAALLSRAMEDKKAVEDYINVSSSALPDAYLMNDFKKALALLDDAVEKKQKIYIYGDYDADGVMSTVILYRALWELGADVHYYVPHRVYDGYGLNSAAVERIAGEGCNMLITCDNGIAALDEIALAKKHGMRVIILDHHEPICTDEEQVLPHADAVVDCKRTDNTYPFRDMCAGGLCYRFVKEFYKYTGRKFSLDRELVTFAGIATVCDIVSLRGDNRVFVKNALYLLNNAVYNRGLCALLNLLGKEKGTISTYTIGFNIGPCINAVGRLETAAEAVELFITTDREKAEDYAKLLVQTNKERQEITDSAAQRLIDTVDPSQAVQVLYDPDIHESVAGLIASRVKEKFYRPTLVITNAENGCKGSGRSVEEYDMFGKMSVYRELFTKFGGHTMACGFSIPYENIDVLRKALNETCGLDPKELEPTLKLVCEIPLDDLNIELAYQLEKLEPFGKDNEKPRYCTRAARIATVRLVGAKKSIAQLTFLSPSGKQIRGIFFDGADRIRELMPANSDKEVLDKFENGFSAEVDITADIAYTVEINSFNGRDYLQINIADIQ